MPITPSDAGKVLNAANAKLGKAYGLNGCAKFVSAVFSEAGFGKKFTSSSWVPTIAASVPQADHVAVSAAVNGDLIVWGANEHVGIYAGTVNGKSRQCFSTIGSDGAVTVHGLDAVRYFGANGAIGGAMPASVALAMHLSNSSEDVADLVASGEGTTVARGLEGAIIQAAEMLTSFAGTAAVNLLVLGLAAGLVVVGSRRVLDA